MPLSHPELVMGQRVTEKQEMLLKELEGLRLIWYNGLVEISANQKGRK